MADDPFKRTPFAHAILSCNMFDQFRIAERENAEKLLFERLTREGVLDDEFVRLLSGSAIGRQRLYTVYEAGRADERATLAEKAAAKEFSGGRFENLDLE